jgi:hypothetical protein
VTTIRPYPESHRGGAPQPFFCFLCCRTHIESGALPACYVNLFLPFFNDVNFILFYIIRKFCPPNVQFLKYMANSKNKMLENIVLKVRQISDEKSFSMVKHVDAVYEGNQTNKQSMSKEWDPIREIPAISIIPIKERGKNDKSSERWRVVENREERGNPNGVEGRKVDGGTLAIRRKRLQPRTQKRIRKGNVKSLRLILVNIGSITSKTTDVECLLGETRPDFAVLNEAKTHCKMGI